MKYYKRYLKSLQIDIPFIPNNSTNEFRNPIEFSRNQKKNLFETIMYVTRTTFISHMICDKQLPSRDTCTRV